MTSPSPSRPGATCAQGGWMQRHRSLAGVPVAVQLWADDRAQGAAAMARVLAEWQRLERSFGPQRIDGELALVNASAADGPVRISGELCRLVVRARWLAQRTQGLFDVTAAALPPADAQADDLLLARAAQAVGWQHLQLDPVGPTLRFARPGLRLALGALLRAHAADAGAALLQRVGVRHAWLRVGDAQRVLGDRRGRPWALPLPHPADPDAVLAVLPLCGRALCTVDAMAAARLRDPRSGRPAQPQPLVAVAAAEGPLAAAWARALQLLGPERGLPLLAAQEDVDALVLDAGGRLHLTAGLQGPQRPPAAAPAERARAPEQARTAAMMRRCLPPAAAEVLDIWFGAGTAERPEWFRKDPACDDALRMRFGAPIGRALEGRLDAWEGQPAFTLAHTVVLDPFPRNALRDTPRTFAGDARALAAWCHAAATAGRRRCSAGLPICPSSTPRTGRRRPSRCACSASWRPGSRRWRGRSSGRGGISR